ncbi:diguanylate cyclase [Stutzerimonas tarimensis]|uniref:diguanylate cyclase n=1 Tax=Stutzerimonas tarimensis TaxID=1507735 RepID=A0ABV7TA44_9GAMM
MINAASRLRAGYMLALLMLLLNLSVPWLGSGWVSRAESRLDWQRHVITESELTLSALKDGETGQRGFVISGRDDFLAPLFQGYVDVDQRLKFFHAEFADDPQLAPMVAQLQILVQQQREYFQSVIELRRREGISAVTDRIAAGEGKRLMDGLRRQLGEISGVLEHRAGGFQAAVEQRERVLSMAVTLIALLDVLILLMLFFFTFRIIRETQQSERHLQEITERLSREVQISQLRNREISLLSLMAQALHSTSDQAECRDIIARFATQLFPHKQGSLFLYHPSRDVLEKAISWGDWSSDRDLFRPDACWALRRGQSHLMQQAAQDLICPHQHDHPQLEQGYLCVPLMAQGEPIGLLSLESPDRHGCELAEAFAEQLSLGIANLSLRETLRQQSVIDALTGLHNRRFLDETLRRELLRATRKDGSVAVAMLDVDHFKRFNDSYGHEAGDLVLRQVALEMKSHVRASDLVCRFGGEEFALVLPEIAFDDAVARCEALRLAVSRLQVRYGGKPLGAITISLGLAFFPQHGREGEALLQLADGALYRAKNQGRNRLCIHTEQGSASGQDGRQSRVDESAV